MSKKNFLSGRDKELHDLSEQYEATKSEGKSIYLDTDDVADLANWYSLNLKADMAEEVIEYGLKLHPENTDLLIEQTYMFINNNKLKKAKESLKKIQEDGPDITLLQANILLEEGEVEKADALIDTIEDKEELGNILDVSQMYIEAGYPKKAAPWIESGAEDYAEEKSYQNLRGDYYYSLKDFDSAGKYYNKLIDDNPYSTLYWIKLANCYAGLEKLDKTIEACDYAIVANQEAGEAYLLKGKAYFQLGNLKEAIKNFKKAQKYKAVDPSFIHIFLSMQEVQEERWEEAYKHLLKAIDFKEKNPKYDSDLAAAYANAALCLHNMGKVRKVNQYCKKAHNLNPQETVTYLTIGRIYMEREQVEKGAKEWAKALKIAPTAETWNTIGICSFEISNYSYAKLAFEHVQELDPNYEGLNENLAALYLSLNDKENFQKYNNLSAAPFSIENMELLKHAFEERGEDNFAASIGDIINMLK